MEILGYTATETLLWDYSETEGYYVLAKPPDIAVKTLFSVPIEYAYQWYGLNGRNGLKIVYYPFDQIRFGTLHDPCYCPVTITASIAVAPSSVTEDGGVSMIYTVTLDTVSDFNTTVSFTLTGTATEGVDYDTVSPHFVSITAGQTTASFSVTPIADVSVEGDETVIATLTTGSSGTNTLVISPAHGTVTGTIIDTPVTPTVTWDPNSVFHVVLSNSNLTNTNTGVFDDNGNAQGAKVTGVASSGKYYFELAYTQNVLVNDEFALGIGSAGGNYDGFNYAPGAYGAVLFGPRFFDIYADSIYTGQGLVTQGGDATGDIFGVAVDLDNHLVWFQVVGGPDVDPVNGWNGEHGDPVAGTGGISIPVGSKTIFGSFSDTDPTESFTLNLGTSPFAGTLPTGYTPGWPAATFVPIVTGATWGSATATNVTLTGGDLIATNTANGPPNPGGAIGTVGSSFGQRLYFEITCTSLIGSLFEQYMIGVGDNIDDIYVHFGTLLASGGVSIDRTGTMWSNGTTTLNGTGGLTDGDVIGVAWDTVSNNIWFGAVGGFIARFGTFWAGHETTSSPPVFPGTNCQGQGMPGGFSKFPIVAWNDFVNTNVATFNFDGPFVGNPMVTWGTPFTTFGGTATRSNGNLTATSTNSSPVAVKSTGGQIVLSPNFASWWFEITLGATYAGTTTSCGLCTYQFDGGLCLLVNNQGLFSFAVDVAGKFWFNNTGFAGSGATAVTLGATAPGDVLQFAVKFGTTSQIWVRINRGGVPQNWNGDPTASPFPASGGFDITALFSTSDPDAKAPFVFLGFNSSGSSATANFGQSTFVTNPPIFPAWGNTFTPWGGTLDPIKTRDTTLSNGNLTATNNYPAILEQGVTVTAASGKTSGKYYFEATIEVNMDGDANIGVAVVGTDYVQFNLTATGGVGVTVQGDIFTNGSHSGYSLRRMEQFDRVGVAVDLDNRTVWFKIVDGSDYYIGNDWNGQSPGDADPTTNLNGIPLVSGTIVPIAAFSATPGDLAGNSVSINTGQTPFAGLTPSGFTAGWPE